MATKARLGRKNPHIQCRKPNNPPNSHTLRERERERRKHTFLRIWGSSSRRIVFILFKAILLHEIECIMCVSVRVVLVWVCVYMICNYAHTHTGRDTYTHKHTYMILKEDLVSVLARRFISSEAADTATIVAADKRSKLN